VNAPLELVALAARTPVGLVAETSAAAVRAGISKLEEFPWVTRRGEPVVVAADTELDPGVRARDRVASLLAAVLDELAPLVSGLGVGLELALALPETRPGFSERDAAELPTAVAAHLRGKGLAARVELAGRGHAGAILAIERAARAPAEDRLFVVLGADSYLDPETFTWLEGLGLFAQPGVRNGFVPGEAAGGLVFATPGLRRQLGLPRLASLAGVGTAHEQLSRDSDTGSLGVGLSEAVATAAAGLDGAEVDTPYIDINGERYRSEEWGFVALRTPALWRSLVYEAPCRCWGDVGAAWAPLAGVLALRSFARGYARGPRAMIMAGSLGGLRGAMLLQADS
jgi:3-oxoacyl-[acyl-carrier-protein] synthase-1